MRTWSWCWRRTASTSTRPRARARSGDRPVVVRPAPAEACFGDVLDAAAGAASGDVVLKMDDDDWYGPDVVTDLLWARRTSGAELVGMPAEFVYLEQLGITVRRRTAVERTARVVAGGTMLIGRDHLRALGGFRRCTVRRRAAARGGASRGRRVHRTQGLGYVLRRGAAGHTWSADLGYFLTRRAVVEQWRGLPAQRAALPTRRAPGATAPRRDRPERQPGAPQRLELARGPGARRVDADAGR